MNQGGTEKICCIPPEAYLYFPPVQEIKIRGKRNFFGGLNNHDFDPQELELIEEFKAYTKKHHYTLKPSIWTDGYILRFLVAAEFKMEKCLQEVKEHTYWRDLKCPLQLTDKLEEFLNSGLLYVHGRDHRFRPIIIFNTHLIDKKQFDMNLVTDALTFWLKYIIDTWMLPHQVEHWVFICNIKGMGMASIAVSSVRNLFAYLQCNFKCRLYKTYLINASAAIYAPWRVVQRFLDGDTKEKIEFCRKSIPKGLFDHTNPEQVEQQYGGTAPNCTQFWPPRIPSNNYFISPQDSKALITKEEYKTLYKKGALKDMKINTAFVDEEPKIIPKQKIIEKTSLQSLHDVDSTNYATQPTMSSLGALDDQLPPMFEEVPRSYSKYLRSMRGLRGTSIYEEDYLEDMSEVPKEKDTIREFGAYFF